MQNLPSGSHFAKLIKSCFIAPPGWVYVASDFNGLEDWVNTVLTKDPNKVKVLKEGFDGHTFRMIHYWKAKFAQLDFNDLKVDLVNALKKPEDALRSKSKPVSFAMQYAGTWATLVKNCGFSEEEAKEIEANYHLLYKVSVEWVNAEIEKASRNGYATTAFGLRVRTPLLNQVIVGNSKTPQEAQAESRTLGNAISGQSYGMLTGRASADYMQKVRSSDKRLKIRLCAQIHDAIYQYVRDDFGLLEWVNTELMKSMHWQDLPELDCEGLKIGSELDIQHPTWKDAFTIPNGASASQIKEICIKEMEKRNE